MGSGTCSSPMDLKSCDARGDLWTMRLWLHVLAGNILHHKMHRLVIYSIVDVYQQNVFCRGRNGAEDRILDQDLVSFRIHSNSTKLKKKSVRRWSEDQTSNACETRCFTEPVLEWNVIFVLRSKILWPFQTIFVVQIPRVTVYRENAEHIRLTAFRWRCDEVEMIRTCLEAQQSMQTKFVINSWKFYQDLHEES